MCLTSQSHGLQHARPPCSSLSPGDCPSSCPLHRWCHSAISSSVGLFSFCLQCFPASGSFPMSRLFASDDQTLPFKNACSKISIMLAFPPTFSSSRGHCHCLPLDTPPSSDWMNEWIKGWKKKTFLHKIDYRAHAIVLNFKVLTFWPEEAAQDDKVNELQGLPCVKKDIREGSRPEGVSAHTHSALLFTPFPLTKLRPLWRNYLIYLKCWRELINKEKKKTEEKLKTEGEKKNPSEWQVIFF